MFRLRKIFAFIFVTCVVFVNASEKSENYKEIRKWTSSGWSISKECFDFIRKVLPEGKTLLELFRSQKCISQNLLSAGIFLSIHHDQ